MPLDTWLYYVVAVFILAISPGPNSLLCMTKGVTLGTRFACMSAVGSILATLLVLTLSFTGLGVIVASSEWVFSAVKWLGAGYLVYLGVQALLSKQASYETVELNSHEAGRTMWRHCASGFLVGASNPKAIVFFTALFPQFIQVGEPLLLQYAIFVGTFLVFESFWLLAYSLLGARSSHWLMQPGRAKVFNRLSGGVFIGAGALLSTTSRS